MPRVGRCPSPTRSAPRSNATWWSDPVAYRPGGMTTCHPERWSTMTRRMPDPPGLDVGQLEAYLRREHPDVVGDGTLSARVIAGGRSNLTYRVDGGVRPLVVRRPPLGHVQTTAHDMAREHRVISGLQGSRVPVPPTVALVADPSAGTGTVFYVMD